MEGVASIVAPREMGFLQRQREGFQLIAFAGEGTIMMRRVVDYRRVGANEHEVVGSRRPRDFGEVFVTQGKFLCILEIDGDVVLEVLHMVAGVLVPGHPGLMLV